MIDQLTDYLEREADKVHVHDTLADIETWCGAGADRRPGAAEKVGRSGARRLRAAAAVALFGLAALDRPGEAPVADGVALAAAARRGARISRRHDGGAGPGLDPAAGRGDDAGAHTHVHHARRDRVRLRRRGLPHAGAYGDGGIDHTDEAQAVITAGSVVSGGCRSTSADGSTWHCALGQRAVDLGIIGQSFLGATSPPGYAYG